MPRRLLNIASIVCVVLCVALMGMWVRSYWQCDTICGYSSSDQFIVGSTHGVVYCDSLVGFPVLLDFASWKSEKYPTANFRQHPAFLGFRFGGSLKVLPYWFLVLVSGSLSAVLWWRPTPRFSLPVLMITTTIVAVAMAIILELNRPWYWK
jgi:hypothetical protein